MKHWENEEFIAEDLVEKIRNKEILVPQYQRGQVWDVDAQEKLIDSIKKGFPFGTILLYFDKEDQRYRLIDGLQRCTTISKYINNPSLIFNKNTDIDDKTIDKILLLDNDLRGNKEEIKGIIKKIIGDWVLSDHEDMIDIKRMQYNRCVREIIIKLPSFKGKELEIEDLIIPMLDNFQTMCDQLSSSKIPAIVYKGEQDNLPEIFTRINSQGVSLSKYQILAATWSHIDYKIESEELDKIQNYVDEYFINLFSDDDSFTLVKEEKDPNTLNLFQILFGFSKVLSEEFEYLFSSNKKSEVESAAFNLITACVGLKNSNMKKLDRELSIHFKTDKELNIFLEKVLITTKRVNRILKPYLMFKNNSREGSKIIHYHTELQICSIIANAFIAKHVKLFDDDQNRIFKININNNNKEWDEYEKKLKENLMKRYLADIISEKWRGSGDSKLNDVIMDREYYTGNFEEQNLRNTLNTWYSDYKYNTKERERVANISNKDKLINAIIYSNTLTNIQAWDETKYDFEHLATKDLLKKHLEKFDKNNSEIHLPISSIGNICLLPEYNNRRKKGKTIYQDKLYKEAIEKEDITLDTIEEKYTFTKEEDLSWIEKDLSFPELRGEYINFIDKRFEIICDKIIDSLYNNPYI